MELAVVFNSHYLDSDPGSDNIASLEQSSSPVSAMNAGTLLQTCHVGFVMSSAWPDDAERSGRHWRNGSPPWKTAAQMSRPRMTLRWLGDFASKKPKVVSGSLTSGDPAEVALKASSMPSLWASTDVGYRATGWWWCCKKTSHSGW